jgi:hypothetical protein
MLTPVEGKRDFFVDEDGNYWQRVPLGDGQHEVCMVSKEWVYGKETHAN